MIKIIVYYIAKSQKDLSDQLCEEFATLCGQFGAKLEFINLFCKAISLSQKQEAEEAQKSYTKEFLKTFKPNQYRIALSPNAKMLDSFEFSKTLQNQSHLAFFIGGAYGLEKALFNLAICSFHSHPLPLAIKLLKSC